MRQGFISNSDFFFFGSLFRFLGLVCGTFSSVKCISQFLCKKMVLYLLDQNLLYTKNYAPKAVENC